ncbi:MAG: hypothetical protein AAGE01_05395 [Pseudomonadota bacterium]
MQYGMIEGTTATRHEEPDGQYGMTTTSAGICFGAPEQDAEHDWRDAQPAAARAADEQD